MLLNRQRAQKYLQKFDFESLFIEELGWDTIAPVTLPFEIDGEFFEVISIAQKRGFTVFKCMTIELPARTIRVKLDRQLTEYSKSHLLVFGDEGKTQQEWLWLKPEPGKSAKVRSHSYKVSQNPEALLQKLEALIVAFKEETSLTHLDVAHKVKQGFDIERVTKQFFQDFEGLHQNFCLEIEGIDLEADRRWYASVLLNRLMFVYFLQRRYFLDNKDALYLQNKLRICQEEGNRFYEFLKDLFFVGFAQPEYERDPAIQKRLGKICYLNGGLFLRHTIEQKYNSIQISDRAFAQVFDLFSRYSWHLDDRPDKDPLEINPDVLGYIFEKYINQKEFGAYYTRPEITEYLCDRTINKLVIDRLAPHPPAPSPKKGEGEPDQSPSPKWGEGFRVRAVNNYGREVGSLLSLIETLDVTQCDRLLNDILPTLTLLDPACGSGAFLVAAMKTLIRIYIQVVARAKVLLESPHPLTPSPKGGEGEPDKENYWEISPSLKRRMTEISRQFRKEPTTSEAILWQALRGRKLDGRKFRRQQTIGNFIVDFFCSQERLVVEVDGGVHQLQQEADRQRQELLESLGLRFVRVKSDLVEQDLPAVLSQIRAAFLPPSPFLGEGLGVRESIARWFEEAAQHPSLDYYIKNRIYIQVVARAKVLLESPHPLTPSPKGGEGEPDKENYWEISPSLKRRMTEISRQFRKEPTTSEAILWQALRGRKLDGRKFRRQQTIGNFIVDFFCSQERLVVEVDGGVHQLQQEADRQRQELLESLGLRFVRVKSDLVEQDLPAVLSQIRAAFLPPSPFLGEGLGVRESIARWFEEAAQHPSLDYYIKKRIITDNLYGVDIMEEATEIAKLRLFLALVSAAKTVNDLEPLPNIDFNIMAGNSLIGLIRVDAEGFDRLSQKSKGKGQKGVGIDPTQINLLGETVLQGNLLQGLAASEYQQILEDKNYHIDLYKKHAFMPGDRDELPQETRLLQLRDHIHKLNQESQTKLNQLLLNEFSQRLGIKYEQAQLKGKPIKRVLNLADIEVLEPFHWGYHFDKVFARGGFDAIIANPPWEIFKPQAKEFFAKHSDLVTKNKMDIKTFEKEQKKLLQDPEIAQAWNEYQSQFPHVSAYFRSSEDYINQISIVNGKKAGTDINLYKLFLERCHHLLRKGGECGIVIPSGIYTDLGTKQLREMLFSQTEVTGLFCFENRRSIFEGVDSRFKFVILSFEKGGETRSFPTRFMRHEVAELATFPTAEEIWLDVDLIRKLSPDSLSVMEFKQTIDITIAKKMLQFPLLGEKINGKWNLKLTAEFHMTNDSYLFKPEPAPGRLPLYEGKMIHQFTHQFESASPRYWVNEKEARQAILGKKEDTQQKLDYQDYRLGFRKIASSTNERAMIATIIPPNFCSENFQVALTSDENHNRYIGYKEMLALCALWNSFVIDSMLRQRISANINFFYVYQLTVPRLQEGDRWFRAIVERAAKLICTTPEFDDLAKEVGLSSHKNGITNEIERAKLRAELDGIISHLYGLTETEFQHILSTFPIVPDPVKLNAHNAYRDVERGLIN